jgi:DNA-binding NarL/FixJ family response regulator
MTIRMLVVDDHQVVRSGVESLTRGTDIEVVAEAATGDEAIAAAEREKPDVVLMDIRMPDRDGLQTLEKLKELHPEVPVLMMSNYDNPTYVARANALGASGYLLKGTEKADLVSTIRAVAAGKGAWKPHELRRVAATPLDQQNSGPISEASLTQRETQVLKQLALGLSNKEIAKTLHISVETVKEHVHHILEKLGVSGRTQAAVWAVRHELV